MENLSTSQGLLRPILNTMALVSRGAISFKGETPESCKVETHTNWQLEECGEWRRVGEEVREAELRGEVRYLGFAALLTLGERKRAGELLTPEEAFRASSPVMTHCISVWLDMLSSKSQSTVGVSHVRQTNPSFIVFYRSRRCPRYLSRKITQSSKGSEEATQALHKHGRQTE